MVAQSSDSISTNMTSQPGAPGPESHVPPAVETAKAMSHTSSLPRPSPWSVRAVVNQISDPPTEGSSSPISFFHHLERLKTEKREGWRRFEIRNGESIADHMYRMSMMTMCPPPSLKSKLNPMRCRDMALVHDMAESLVGDLTPMDGVPKSEKNRREGDTMDYIAEDLLGKVYGGEAGKYMREVWQEYEDSETLDSKFVHDVDKVELLLQMMEYEKRYDAEKDLGEFSRVAEKIFLDEMKEWAQEILEERTVFWRGKGKTPSFAPDLTKAVRKAQDEYYGNGEGGNGAAR